MSGTVVPVSYRSLPGHAATAKREIGEIEGHLYAVVNANTFEGIDPSSFAQAAANFDDEDAESRLARRKRNWIGTVRIPTADDRPAARAALGHA
ncbi:MAG TPA: hypothetical protein VIL60_09135 [Rhodanobacter sp.]